MSGSVDALLAGWRKQAAGEWYLGRHYYRVGISWYVRAIGPVPTSQDRHFSSRAGARLAIREKKA